MNRWILKFASSLAQILPNPIKRGIYQTGPLARLIRRSLNRAAPQGLAQIEVAAGGLTGAQLFLDLQSEKDYWLGTYEPELMATVGDLVQPGMTVYDVGANIGYITLLLARRVQPTGRVFAFEALPANVERIHLNLSQNSLKEMITVVPEAVVDRAGEVHFLVGPSHGTGKVEGSAGRKELMYPEMMWVQGIGLDQFVYQRGNPPPQVVKIDIEGGEVLALPGMRRVLREAKPILLLELHGPEAAQIVWTELSEAGYRVCRMQPGYPQVNRLEVLDWKEYLAAFPIQVKPGGLVNVVPGRCCFD